MKKILALLMLTVMMTCTLQVPAMTQEQNLNPGGGVSVQFANVASVSTLFKIDSDGMAICSASSTITKNHKSRLTITLMRSKNSGTFSNVTSWTKNFTGLGAKTLTKARNVKKGYTYRFKLVVRIFSGDTVIEKITRYSSSVAY